MTDQINKISKVQQSRQLDNPMESEEEQHEVKLETDKLRLEMNTEFKRWKTSFQEKCKARATNVHQIETKLVEMRSTQETH